MVLEVDGALRGLSVLMPELRRQFAGDLDRALIILTLFMEGSPAAETGSTSAIARVTGIPRESVRRKLERMRRAAQVVREADGRWRVSDRTRGSLRLLLAASTPPTIPAHGRLIDDQDRSAALDNGGA